MSATYNMAYRNEQARKWGFHPRGVKISPVADAFGAPRHYNPRLANWSASMSANRASASRQTTTPGTDPENSNTTTSTSRLFSSHAQKVIFGVILMLVTAVFWVGVTQFSKSTYQHGIFNAPFLVVYLSTAWTLFFYPGYLIVCLIRTKGRLSLSDTLRENLTVYSDAALTYQPAKVIGKLTGFSLLWVLTNYVFMRAVSMKPCLDVVALFATNSSFVYLLSWILLKKQFMGSRIVATLMAMAGTCVLTYMDGGLSGASMWGAILVVCSTASAATFKVLFRKVAGEDATSGQVSIFMSSIGVFSVIILWPLILLLHFTRAEPIVWDKMPWGYIWATIVTALVVSIILSYGPAVAYPVFLQFSFVIAIPFCAGVDILWRKESFSGMQIASFVLIGLSTLLNLVPEDWQASLLSVQIKKRKQRDQKVPITSPRQQLRSTAC